MRIAPVMEHIKDRLGFNLSKKQRDGVEMVFRRNLSIITGGPGTGKSTVLKAVIEAYRTLYPRKIIKLAAPTGKASRRMAETTGIMDAQTLHSLLGLHGGGEGWQKKKNDLDADLVIVDETSMMDMGLAWQLFRHLRPGTKLLLVGDADQLESVGAGDVFHELIDSGIVPVTVLDEIFRQAKDSPIPHNAKYINEGEARSCTSAETSHLFRRIPRRRPPIWYAAFTNAKSPRAASTRCRSSPLIATRGEASSDALNEAIREEVNPPLQGKPEVMFGGSMFRLDDRVMQTKNNGLIQLRDDDGQGTDIGRVQRRDRPGA